MSLLVVTYILIGLYFGFYQVFMMQNTTPRIMDIVIMDTMREMKDEDKDFNPSPESVEFMIILSVTVAYVLAWPLILVWSTKQ